MAIQAGPLPGAALPRTDGPRSLALSLERLRCRLLWATAFSGCFVFMEPSPYEVVSVLTIAVFLLTGLRLRSGVMPLVLLLMLSNIGYSVAVIPLADQNKPVTWVLISWYMAATGVFYALALAQNTAQRLDALLRGYTAAAVVCSLVAVAAYFHVLPGAETFLRYGRARSTFNDPNVLGAFLVLPGLLAFSRVLSGSPRQAMRAAAALAVIVMALLLSFSRGAWGQFAATAGLLMGLMFLTSRSGGQRVRIVALAILGVVVFALFVAALLSIKEVADLFTQRASFDQDYDSGHFGRFGRHVLGFMLALDRPFGIGPLQFATIFPEDPHNTYLNAFMSGGWISGLCYPVIVLVTAATGARFLVRRSPWQRIYLVVYCAFLGVVGESAIIDIDHWRHFYLLLGTLWGLMIATRAHQARMTASSGRSGVAEPGTLALAPPARAMNLASPHGAA